MAARPRKPLDQPWYALPLKGAPAQSLTDLLDWHERRLSSYRTRAKSEQHFVRELDQLLQSSRQALRDGRLEDTIVDLCRIERFVGFQQGVEHCGAFLNQEVLPTVRNLWREAKREVRAEAGHKGGKARTENLREEWNRWHGEALLLSRRNPSWTRRRVMQEVAKGANPRRSWRTVDQKVRGLERTRGRIDA